MDYMSILSQLFDMKKAPAKSTFASRLFIVPFWLGYVYHIYARSKVIDMSFLLTQ